MYDIIIIGGGPSGSMLGYLCAKSGMKVIILDKKKFPRDKPCGGGLTNKSIEILKKHNLFENSIIEKECHSVKIHLANNNSEYLIPSNDIYMITVERMKFDHFMLTKAINAGCEVNDSCKYTDYKIEMGGTIKANTNTNFKYETRILVGADGARSNIYTQMSESYPQLFPIRKYLLGISTNINFNKMEHYDNNIAHLFFNIDHLIDYAWAFPLKGLFNVGMGMKYDNHNKINIKDRFNTFTRDFLHININNYTVKGALLPIYWTRKQANIQWDNIFLIGDAAGFVDEWTGEGLYYGLKSAEYAHDAIKGFIGTQKKRAFLYSYTNKCERNIINNLVFSHYFANGFRSRPNMYNYLKYRSLRELFIPFASGKMSYKSAILKAAPRIIFFKTIKEIKRVFFKKQINIPM